MTPMYVKDLFSNVIEVPNLEASISEVQQVLDSAKAGAAAGTPMKVPPFKIVNGENVRDNSAEPVPAEKYLSDLLAKLKMLAPYPV